MNLASRFPCGIDLESQPGDSAVAICTARKSEQMVQRRAGHRSPTRRVGVDGRRGLGTAMRSFTGEQMSAQFTSRRNSLPFPAATTITAIQRLTPAIVSGTAHTKSITPKNDRASLDLRAFKLNEAWNGVLEPKPPWMAQLWVGRTARWPADVSAPPAAGLSSPSPWHTGRQRRMVLPRPLSSPSIGVAVSLRYAGSPNPHPLGA